MKTDCFFDQFEWKKKMFVAFEFMSKQHNTKCVFEVCKLLKCMILKSNSTQFNYSDQLLGLMIIDKINKTIW